jgi:signal transduction histidine kinase
MKQAYVTTDLLSMERLVDTVQALSFATDIESVMYIVRNVARELTGADGATFVLRDNDMCYYADEDAISPLWKGLRFPIKICISGWVMLNKKPAIIPDIYKDERIPADAYRPTFVKSLAMVPIRTIAPIGAIGNYWAKIHLPTEEEVSLLQALADITAVSIENIDTRNRLREKISEREQMLSQLEKQKSQLEEFNHIISHNLRAPLSNLLLLNDMLANSQSLDDKLRYIEKQKQVVDILHNTFDELVDAAQVKIDFTADKEFIPLEQGLGKALKMLQGEIENSKATVTYDFSLAKSVYYPQKYFDSIILNLLSNAIRYKSDKRLPQIQLRSWKDGDWTYLEIEDNGLGIDLEKHRDNIFKLHKTFHDHPQAKGFGLFITKTQVEAMGGNIRVESTVGKGSRFIVQLSKNK